jgi:twinkle protein
MSTETGAEEATFVRHAPCPSCGSRDNLGIYSDGHGWCFGCGFYQKGDNDASDTGTESRVSDPAPRGAGGDSPVRVPASLLAGEYSPLSVRHISAETCRKWDYRTTKFQDKMAQAATYYTPDGTAAVAQKIRMRNKEFTIVGDIKLAGLYGQHLFRDKGKMVVITEGEIDAMSVSQLQQHKYPVVSVPNGAQGAKKAILKQLEWLMGFDHVVLMFDNDDQGRAAALECAAQFPPGRCKIASLPLKDANDMLVAGRGEEIINAMWGAKTYRPDGLVTLAEVRTEVLREPEQGLPWYMPTLTKLTYGRRLGECYAFGAGTGVGKTDWLVQQIAFDLIELKESVGLFFLEQQPAETVKRLAGKIVGKRFHVPSDVAGWQQSDLEGALDVLQQRGALHLYNHFGSAKWETIQARIRYLARSEGVRLFYLDHLTALAAEEADERRALEGIMANIGGLVKELNIVLHFVSHLATPEGKPHEEGGRVMIRHFKGSRAIGFWSHFMFGLERDQQADPGDDATTTFRVLKDRYTGDATGKTFHINYDPATGMLAETDGPVTFDDESSKGDF